jgi:hypothetical protein
VTLTHIKPVTDKAGKTRRYLRVKGKPLLPLPDLPMSHPDFIAAWIGHQSLSEVTRYTRSADRRKSVMGAAPPRTPGERLAND